MPALVRKLSIFTIGEGLILQPISQRGQRPQTAIKIGFEDQSIRPVLDNTNFEQHKEKSFEAYGIAGLVTVSRFAFLISIIRRDVVAQIQGKPIYVITEVALTPLTSKAEAEASITRTRAGLNKNPVAGEEGDGLIEHDAQGEDLSLPYSDDVDDDDLSPNLHNSTITQQIDENSVLSVAKDVISRKGTYGRFAQKWFSKNGWTAGQRRSLGMSLSNTGSSGQTLQSAVCSRATFQDQHTTRDSNLKHEFSNEAISTLLPKLLRTTQLLLGSSHSFYFSYEYDITRSLAQQNMTHSGPPLYSAVDSLFFWNRSLMSCFIEAGQSTFVLPLMQGFVGEQSFTMDTNPPVVDLGEEERNSIELSDLQSIPQNMEHDSSAHSPTQRASEKHFVLVLISRRSVKRAGLRYLRRGVDEEGHVANYVETEQILSDIDPSSHNAKMQSYLQLRGSVPIFWTQSPYSFKPVPILQHSKDINFRALQKHFESISDRYGSVEVISLVEKHGQEAALGQEYAKYMSELNALQVGRPVGFEWFDFHAVCRGMHFENVSYLLDSLHSKLDQFGSTVVQDGKMISKQQGVLRSNCMDCLDRTNVVQSALARVVLEAQLKSEGIDSTLQVSQSTSWFDTLWADNGDALSKQYASTAALKGDFTRTRRRNYKGALTDMGLSISRYYSGIVNDYFSQAAISFLVGDATEVIFSDFETTLMSQDPAISMHKMRQQAIDVCQQLVIADDSEELDGAWTVLSPHVSNTIKSTPFEEIVLLVTNAALYACKFDWDTEKLASFERVELVHIIGIQYGTYITSVLSTAQCDEMKNIGFVVTYVAGNNDITRVNRRSMSTIQALNEAELQAESASSLREDKESRNAAMELSRSLGQRILAFKALPSKSAAPQADSDALSELEHVRAICTAIERMVALANPATYVSGAERNGIVQKANIITLAEARRGTGLIEQLGHSLKKLVWA